MNEIKFRGREKYTNRIILSNSLIQEYEGGGYWGRGLLERELGS